MSVNYIYKFITYLLLLSSAFIGHGLCEKKAAIVIDYDANRKIAFSNQAEATRYPASLTKMMTIYLLFEAIKQNKITLNTKFKVSKLATKQAPSKLDLRVGEKITVLNLIKALLVKSANDAAVVIAEGLVGSTEKFGRMMTAKAKQLGMKNTYFANPSGLPNSRQVTCAKDIATLGMAIFKDFPQYWYLFSIKSFCYNGRTHNTHCKILNWCKGTDGGKTGFTYASGFNLFVTAKKYNSSGNSKRVFVVVMGGDSGKSRDLYAAFLINKYLHGYTICSSLKKIKTKQDKKRKSLMDQIEKMDRKPQPAIVTPPSESIIYECEEFSVAEILELEKMKPEDLDEMYAVDEDVVKIDNEIFIGKVEPQVVNKETISTNHSSKVIPKGSVITKGKNKPNVNRSKSAKNSSQKPTKHDKKTTAKPSRLAKTKKPNRSN
ncbi:MAG: D-alanyl-D-alanine carboxypeptidase [Holosporales bacterium]|nr:D-alanyl-D-alanine carboxypeptidase [Holosporales bacterium]